MVSNRLRRLCGTVGGATPRASRISLSASLEWSALCRRDSAVSLSGKFGSNIPMDINDDPEYMVITGYSRRRLPSTGAVRAACSSATAVTLTYDKVNKPTTRSALA